MHHPRHIFWFQLSTVAKQKQIIFWHFYTDAYSHKGGCFQSFSIIYAQNSVWKTVKPMANIEINAHEFTQDFLELCRVIIDSEYCCKQFTAVSEYLNIKQQTMGRNQCPRPSLSISLFSTDWNQSKKQQYHTLCLCDTVNSV